jgi:hypothetical protein
MENDSLAEATANSPEKEPVACNNTGQLLSVSWL